MSKQVTTKGQLEYRQFIILEDGTEIRVRYNQNPELYKGTDVPLYEYEAKEGKGDNAVTVKRFAVPFEQAVRASRAKTGDKVEAMLAQGLTAEEIVAQLRNNK
jgi:hypothetical protein